MAAQYSDSAPAGAGWAQSDTNTSYGMLDEIATASRIGGIAMLAIGLLNDSTLLSALGAGALAWPYVGALKQLGGAGASK